MEVKIELCQNLKGRNQMCEYVSKFKLLCQQKRAGSVRVCLKITFCSCAAFQKRGLCMTLILAYCGIEEIRVANCPDNTLSEENSFPTILLLTHM